MNVKTKFFAFHQNNSGGSFDHDPARGIGLTVWIEAVDAAHANALAEIIGLYFDGCRKGIDCSCCGDRWNEADSSDAGESSLLYGEPWREAKDGEAATLDWRIPSYIHRLNGDFKVAVRVTA